MVMKINNISLKIKENIKKLINSENFEKAKPILNEYKKLVPDDIEIYSIESILSLAEGKLYEAEKILMQGLLKDNSNFDLNYNLAYVYEKEQQFKEALNCYEKSLIYCDNDNLKEELSQKIKEISNSDSFKYQNMIKSACKIKKILFIQSVPDIRTNKIAQVLYDKSIQVDIMYLMMHPKDIYVGMKLPYKKVYRINDINNTVDFINKSDYDILISCNEPDYLTALLECTNKPIIHDCHDMMSLRGNITYEQLILEYIANAKCDGNIYVTELVEKVAENKFSIKNKPVMILDNYVLKNQLPGKFLKKLSDMDNEIHCVYEGGLSDYEGHHRNIKDIFLNLAKNKIHVHYYASFENTYYRRLAETSKYLHCEDTKEPKELIEDMTKYDIGLAVLNVTKRNKTFLDTTFPNKAWEYLASGLPILFSDLASFKKFLEHNHVGEVININNIKGQIERVKNIKISKDYLKDNKLCMDDFADNIIYFLESVKSQKYSDKEKKKLIEHNQNDKELKSILIMTPSMNIGGAEEYTINKANWLVKNGYKVTVVSSGGKWIKRLNESGVKHYEFSWIASEDPDSLSKSELKNRIELLKTIIGSENIDIVEGHNLYPGVYGYILCKKYNIPFLFNVLSQEHFILIKKYVPLLQEMDKKNIYYNLTDACNDDIEKNNNIKLKNCINIPIPVSMPDVKNDVCRKDRYILSVCRLEYTKYYIFYLIESFVSLCINKKLTYYDLVIVGDGKFYNEINESVEEYNTVLKRFNCRIILKGFLYGEELQQLYRNCSIYVGQSTTVLTAASYKKPVILAATPPDDVTVAYGYFSEKYDKISLGEVVNGMKPGKYEDYIYQLLVNKQLYDEISNIGYEIVMKNFSLEKVMKKWELEYKRVIRLYK